MGIKRYLKKLGLSTTEEVNNLKNEVASLRDELSSNLKFNELNMFIFRYKMWELNNNNNILFYEMYLDKCKRRKNFNPLVSIVIPVYNGSNYLSCAIDAALNQTYKNIEVIVVNDGSTDNKKSEKIAKKYGNKIKYYYKDNGGVSSALNYGIERMNGDYFAWLSHDDFIEKNHIEKLVELVSCEGNEKVIPFSSFKVIDTKNNLDIKRTIDAQLVVMDYKMSKLKNYYSLLQGEINGGSVLIPKEAFEKYGYFDESLRITQERDMWSRLIKEYHFINVPYDTASVRVHSNQVTTTAKDVVEKTEKKSLDIINSLTREEIEQLEYNKSFFYTKMYHFYNNNGRAFLAKKMKKKIEKKNSKS